MRSLILCVAAIAAAASSAAAYAQEAGEEKPAPAAEPSGDAEDTVATVSLPSADEQIDPATITLPDLKFTSDAKLEKDFDKYFYFHRDSTDFKTALADLRDCDGLSRGLASPYGNMDVPYPYNATPGGLVGGALGNLMVAAIFGSAQVRATRRINMRRCMHFKGYQRYGLPKDIWKEFNFEEGFSELAEDKRQAFLKQQAKATSGPKPQTAELGK
jgi:hypothetical protein